MISAVILAAGKSTRMGQQKMLMPWGDTTVLGRVVQTLQQADIEDIVIVANQETGQAVTNLPARITVNNEGDMLTSLQAGVQAVSASVQGMLVCLGDQPQIEEGSVRSVCEAFQKSGASIVVPSYRNRRGHPWLAGSIHRGRLLQMRAPQTLRDFLREHAGEIEYVEVETPSVIEDLDTYEDYLKYKP